jgi:hypothetical protein
MSAPHAKEFVCEARCGYKFAMPNQPDEPPAEPIRFKTNVIAPVEGAPGGSRFIVAGEDSPYRSLEEVPTRLRPVIMRPEDFGSEPESDEPPSATLNTVYNVDENG